MRTLILSSLLLLVGCSDDAGSGGGGSSASSTQTAGSGTSLATTTASGTSSAATGSGGDGGGGSAPVDPTFSFVVIPDTQNEILNDNNAAMHFDHRIEWVLDNRDTLDIRFALQTGDLCNWDTPNHDQYVRASEGLTAFDDAGFPYMLAIGNHDTAATCTGGSACPGDVNANLRNTSTFNSFFPVERFPTMTGTFEPNKVDNSYHLIEAGGLDWIIISMELWPREKAYQWVGETLAAHPKHNGIVITHSHLTGAGTIKGNNGGYGDNSPQEVFDEVYSQHSNLRFVFSGHEGLVGFRQDEGVSGNAIYQFLFNQDNATNPTRIVSIDTEARTIDSYVYGPATDKTYTEPGASVTLTDVDFVK